MYGVQKNIYIQLLMVLQMIETMQKCCDKVKTKQEKNPEENE